MIKKLLTEEELLKIAHELSHKFYNIMGYHPRADYKLYQSRHPQEQRCWQMACLVMDQYHETDMECVLQELGEDYE